MAYDTNVQTFTDAELLNLVRHAIVTVMIGGQSYTINGRNFTRADLSELRKIESELQTAISNTADSGGVVLVQYGERV